MGSTCISNSCLNNDGYYLFCVLLQVQFLLIISVFSIMGLTLKLGKMRKCVEHLKSMGRTLSVLSVSLLFHFCFFFTTCSPISCHSENSRMVEVKIEDVNYVGYKNLIAHMHIFVFDQNLLSIGGSSVVMLEATSYL